MAEIHYVSKEELTPNFGKADEANQIVWVRVDLPKLVKNFVLEHELYHLRDKAKFWLWREIKANCYAAIKHPLGFIITVFMSLSVERLKYYLQRFKQGV